MHKPYLFSFAGHPWSWIKYVLLLSAALASAPLAAQVSCGDGPTCTQTLTLTPGWNSIYVQVKPDQDRTEQVFADLLDGSGPQISSVWTWLAHRARVDFIQDPNAEDLLSKPGWLRYFPAPSKQGFLTNLFTVQGNRAYLVKLEGSDKFDLSITGLPVVPRAAWSPDSFNLTGFHIDPRNPPTFDDFLAASPAHKAQPVYQLLNNVWQQVILSTPIRQNVAYWVFSKGGSNYTGPLQVELPQLDRLEYGQVLEQMTVRFQNLSAAKQSATLRVLGAKSGMNYPNPDLTANARWLPLPQPLQLTLADDGETRLPLGMRRADFYPGNFEQTLEITGQGGSRWLIPVSAAAPELHSLWVGTVSIDQVSQAQNYQHNCDEDGTNPGNGGLNLCLDSVGLPIGDSGEVLSPVATEFSFRIILHRNTANDVVLLKQVIQMWKDGVGDEPGHYALITDDALIPNFTGVALRDGIMAGRRISSMAYDFPGDTLAMTGTLDGILVADITLASSAPTNPFRHQYHPSHNNLAIDYQTESKEAYEVTRSMTLNFADAVVCNALACGYDRKDGSYTEQISGLHKHPIIASGRFTLRHAAPTQELNQ